ncbi:hypothetical protein LQT97_22170 [Brucella pseudogrignonensis]|jgi:hypothetical protein|uniref:hypothetical protein n=1 Tax=Brucella TaxID=234 RepID=UPI00148B8BC2|nr:MULTISPECIES: hypothetical protein [Brucella]MCD4513941.1 hypothetical protein [Brucella pseudogrignonensis]
MQSNRLAVHEALVDPALGAKRIEGGAVRSVVKKPTGWRRAKTNRVLQATL